MDEEISPFLQQINKFIHSHRMQHRNVLVFSNAGLCRAPTIIAQYLIQVWRVYALYSSSTSVASIVDFRFLHLCDILIFLYWALTIFNTFNSSKASIYR